MSNISNELEKILNRRGIKRQVEAVGVVEEATAEVAKFIDPQDFEVISFKEGLLKIKANSSVVACEIQMATPKILNSSQLIKKIKIIN
jgi:hypothetical protein